MKFKYQVEVLSMKEVHEIPGAWKDQDFIDLLKNIDFDEAEDLAPAELKEMTAMALSDLTVDQAAEAVLLIRLGDRINNGQRQNLAQELRDDRLWEEYSDLRLHEEIFNAACMLHGAFPKTFAEPDIIKLHIKITAENTASYGNLAAAHPTLIARLLNDGMDHHNIMFRLFEDKLGGSSFPEAQDIIWQTNITELDQANRSATYEIYTSLNWVDELKGVKAYTSAAYADMP